MQETMKRFKEQNESTDPKQPGVGLLSLWSPTALAGQHLGLEISWREATKGSQKDHEPLGSTAQHGLGRRFPPASAPDMLGVSPSCPPPAPPQTSPSSKHLHLLPGHGHPPPPGTSDIPQLPREQEQRRPMLPGWMQHRDGTWEDTHTDQGQKSHQIIGKQRACNNEKRTDFVTNHFFL